jgi:hypothetical protein
MATSDPERILAPPYRGEGHARSWTSAPIPIEFVGPEHRFYRADLEIDGITHEGPSYEGRIFFNNQTADRNTATTPENGYAGSFHILGHGGCLGDAGHCEVKAQADAYDFRTPHPLTPALKRVTVTEALHRACAQGAEVVVTVVPVVNTANELVDVEDVFHCSTIHFLTYN